MIWYLIINIACSGWGCGDRNIIRFPDKESCYEALRETKLIGQSSMAGADQNQGVAYCMPAAGKVVTAQDEGKSWT